MSTEAATAPVPTAPSLAGGPRPAVTVATAVPASAGALGVCVGTAGPVPDDVGLDRDRLAAAGFAAGRASALAVPTASGPITVAVGVGDPAAVDAAVVRDAAAAFARVSASHGELALSLAGTEAAAPEACAQAAVEGVLLARYRYDVLRRDPAGTPVTSLTLVTSPDREEATRRGAERGAVTAFATIVARDLANAPHNHLSATRMAELATAMAADGGFDVEVFDEEALVALGCGGLLGVNAGSAEPPVMIKLTYRPPGEPLGRLTLVGKGIMYDSGGIALKPGDVSHSQMKNDMSGAAAILAAMAALPALGCASAVTGYLMCTDNMPSGTAMALGDVITMRGGTSVEVVNTDAEGRLVMADALVLATEEPVDAIVDIATLTGACLRALGTEVAGVMGNDEALIDRVRAAAEATDEPVWQLPLATRYRPELDSDVADMKNLGGPNAGAITAALFLAEFVGGVPWAHIDIAGTAQSATDAGWRPVGCTGFGARLLVQLALDFAKGSA